jgi:hypothetical protein
MAKQTITWTTLPRGATGDGSVRFALHVAPRLETDGASSTLGQQFADFVDWPATLAGLGADLAFPDLGLTFPATLTPAPGAAPDSAKWTALFPPATFVRGHSVPGFNGIKLASYPVANVVGVLAELWGRFGATRPEDYPTFEDVIEPFRDIGFLDFNDREQGKNGWDRLADLRAQLAERYTKNGGAVPYDPDDANTAAGRGLSFLQLLDFHQRGLQPSAGPPPIRVKQKLDFHQVVALAANHGLLQQLLGLVLEFTVTPTRALTALLAGPVQTQWCTVKLTVPGLDAAMTRPVLARTRSHIGDSRFEAAPRTADDLSRGLLRIGDADRFGVFTVDPDGGALKAMQFAATVTRSHITDGTQWRGRSLGTAEEYPLPALRTGGVSVAKLGLGFLMFSGLKDKAALNISVYQPPANQEPADLDLYAEDLIRGYRWDVRDTADGAWRTLMDHDGAYELRRLPAGDRLVPVREEAAAVTAVTTADTESKDLYLQESIVSWGGWSLAVPRLNKTVGLEGDTGDAEGEIDEEYQFATQFHVPPATLPRLRFGHGYRFRARAVDIGNGGLPFAEGDLAIGGPDTVTGTHRFLRYEPVEAPTVALRKPRWPGESPAHVAVRADHEVSERHVVPPRTAVSMAEWHGLLDLDAPGHPMDAASWSTLDGRDAARLEDLLDPNQTYDPHTNPAWFDMDTLPVPYLPDPLARRAFVRGLPTTPTAEVAVPFAAGAWPATNSFRLSLKQAAPGAAKWELNGRTLGVWLEPGDIYRLKISCQFDPADVNIMALWRWILDWIARWNASHPPNQQIDANAVRKSAEQGRHWMFTPWRPTTLVHAVRTPLRAPDWVDLRADRDPGATDAVIGKELNISQKSTGTLDIVGAWQMPIDNGPGSTAPDPTVPQPFSSTAYSVAVSHPVGPAPDTVNRPISGRHEFGDHKYRRVGYHPVATTAFVEYFREEVSVVLAGTLFQPLPPGTALTTVKVRNKADGTVYQPAPLGQLDATTATGDYVISPTTMIARAAGGAIPSGTEVIVSFAREPITRSGPVREVDVLNSSRPAAPKVLYVVPTFKWQPTPDGSQRLGGGLRVYLDRPWWSSGDGERLGVVTWIRPDIPPEHVLPYVTGWAPDPVTSSATIPNGPTLAAFPLADSGEGGEGVTIAEVPNVHVHVSGHSVTFDRERDLWYCDLRVTEQGDTELPAYFPYVRLALARYQPHSLPDCHLSTVVLAEYIQLANGRTASIVPAGNVRIVTVTGRASTGNFSGIPSQVRALVERRNTIADPDLGWEQVGQVYPLAPSISDGNSFTWSTRIPAPGRGQHRLVLEEYETLPTGDSGLTPIMGERVVYTEILPFS